MGQPQGGWYKAEAFRKVVRAGMHDLATGIAAFHAEGGAWVPRFVTFYMGERRHAAVRNIAGQITQKK